MSSTVEQVKKSDKTKKERLLRIMGNKCCICGYNKCSKALEFHHKNPEEKSFTISENPHMALDKLIEELNKTILVCANCHREIHEGLIDITNIECFDEEIAQKEKEENDEIRFGKKNYCIDCGTEIKNGIKRCPQCAILANRVVKDRPSREELKELIRNKPFTQIGAMYNVSDRAIAKWCITEKLPYRKKDIKEYTDEEWDKI